MADRESLTEERYKIEDHDIVFPLQIKRDLHLSDLYCYTCKRKFNSGISNSKKKFCNFCYRGTCSSCLNSDYFHSESGRLEQMCICCSNKLVIMRGSALENIEKMKLIRLELRSLINNAKEQRKSIVQERKIVQNRFEDAQKKALLTSKDKNDLLDILRKKNQRLVGKIRKNKRNIEDIELKNEIFGKRFNKMNQNLESFLNQKEKQAVLSEEIRNELNIYYFRTYQFRENKEIDLAEYKEIIKIEIEDLEFEIEDKTEMNKNLIYIHSEIKSQIEMNNEKIIRLQEEASEKSTSKSEITEEEHEILQSLSLQVKQLDELIKINDDMQKYNGFEEIDDKCCMNSSILDTQVSEKDNIHQKRTIYSHQQVSCMKKCNIF